MEIDGIVWLVLPMIALFLGAAIAMARPKASKPSKKSFATGIVLAAIIFVSYIILRSLFLGGF